MWNSNKEYTIELYRKFNSLEEYLLEDINPTYKECSKVIVADCDGIISTNESFYDKTGKIMKSYGCYDKEMIKLMRKIGWEIIFVTADRVGYPITKARVDDLDCTLVVADGEKRVDLVRRLKNGNDIVVFVGDSISDIPALAEANWSGTTVMAPKEVQEFCDYISEKNGGYGGFADIIWNIHKELNLYYK